MPPNRNLRVRLAHATHFTASLLPCPEPGCTKSFKNRSAVRLHRRTVHATGIQFKFGSIDACSDLEAAPLPEVSPLSSPVSPHFRQRETRSSSSESPFNPGLSPDGSYGRGGLGTDFHAVSSPNSQDSLDLEPLSELKDDTDGGLRSPGSYVPHSSPSSSTTHSQQGPGDDLHHSAFWLDDGNRDDAFNLNEQYFHENKQPRMEDAPDEEGPAQTNAPLHSYHPVITGMYLLRSFFSKALINVYIC